MGKTAAKGKKAAKRNSEARREQNRVASRNYREKRRQRLALLDQLLDGDSSKPDVPAAAHDHVQVQAESADTEGLFSDAADGVDELVGGAATEGPGMGDAFSNAPDVSTTHLEYMPFRGPQLVPYGAPTSAHGTNDVASWMAANGSQPASWGDFADGGSSSWAGPIDAIISDTVLNPFLPAPTHPTQTGLEQNKALFSVLQDLENLSISQKRALIRYLQQQTGDDAVSSQTPPPSSITSFMTPRITGTAIPNPTSLQIQARRFAAIIEQQAAASSGPTRVPSNCNTETGLFGALFANCYALGMRGVEALVVEEGWSIFTLGPEIGYHPSQLSVVRSRYRHLAPDLRPCDAQHTIAHHPYIDVIPFRYFREKALKALENEPPLLDEDELCQDLLAGGLICWGSQQSGLGMEAAVPWDMRSWEAKPWFLKKYFPLVGGWDDDMWKGARRWSGLRGERIQPCE